MGRMRIRVAWLCAAALVHLLPTGCEVRTRHRVLTLFFDGVPPLDRPTEPEASKAPSLPHEPPETIRVVEAPPPAPPRFVHSPFEEGECQLCHEADRGNRTRDAPELCWDCHDAELADVGTVHGPVALGECLTCHNPHQSAFPFLLQKAAPDLCLDCHDPADLAVTRAHVMAGDRGCTLCHAPHASDFPGLLISKTGGRVCFLCHEASEVLDPDHLTHEPVREGRCFDCHTSHGEGYGAHLIVEKETLCDECHEVPGDALVVHPPADEKACLGCHNPHGSALAANLVEQLPELCWECHDEALMQGSTKHEPAEEGGCPQCHSPHGSDDAFLLLEPVLVLCGSCHQGESEHVDRMLAGQASCVGCHTPHSSEHPQLFE